MTAAHDPSMPPHAVLPIRRRRPRPGRWAVLVMPMMMLAGTMLAPAPAEAATASHRQAAAARPAKATATRPHQARAATRRHRPARPGPAVAFDAAEAPLPAVQGPVLTPLSGSPRAACLAAARQAERTHGLPEGLMVAVALSESGLHAHALNIRGRAHFPEDRETARALVARAGGRGFAGCVQISLGHARGSDWPLDPVQATDWAGALLARAHAETGSWIAAVARFHGGSPRGSQRVICRVRAKLEVTAPGSPALRDASCGGDIARERRNGAALLEIAEAQ